MAYANNFNGDVVQLNYILQTLEDKLYAIPGVTCDDGLSMNISGETFDYWVRSKANVGNAAPGAPVTYESTGARRVSESFKKAKQIYEVIPNVNFSTVNADVVGDKVIQDTMIVANQMNEEFVRSAYNAAVSASAVASTTYGAADDPYQKILSLRAEFVKANADHNVRPTACLVSSDLYSALLAKNVIIFKDGKKFGELLGFPVIEVPSLDSGLDNTVTGYDGTVASDARVETADTSSVAAIMLNAKGMISAENVNSLMVTDATPAGYPAGTLIAGEIGYDIGASALVKWGEGCKPSETGADVPEGFTGVKEKLIMVMRKG